MGLDENIPFRNGMKKILSIGRFFVSKMEKRSGSHGCKRDLKSLINELPHIILPVELIRPIKKDEEKVEQIDLFMLEQ